MSSELCCAESHLSSLRNGRKVLYPKLPHRILCFVRIQNILQDTNNILTHQNHSRTITSVRRCWVRQYKRMRILFEVFLQQTLMICTYQHHGQGIIAENEPWGPQKSYILRWNGKISGARVSEVTKRIALQLAPLVQMPDDVEYQYDNRAV